MSEKQEFTGTEVAYEIKKIVGRRIPVSELNKYAESFGMIKENRSTHLGGSSCYYWSKENFEKLKKIIKDEN